VALNKTTLKEALKTAFEANLSNITTGQASQIDSLCDAIASGIDTYVRAATIVYTAGLVAPNGPVTGVFTGNIT